MTWWALLAIANLGQKPNNNCLRKSRISVSERSPVCDLAGDKKVQSGEGCTILIYTDFSRRREIP